jgi:hypothetical protein
MRLKFQSRSFSRKRLASLGAVLFVAVFALTWYLSR